MKTTSARTLLTLMTITFTSVAVTPASAAAPLRGVKFNDDATGRIVARVDGREVSLPLLNADYDIDVQGDLANVTLTQTFINPTSDALNATYLFPLNQKAAVHAMEMALGDEIIRAVIKRKGEARATFDKAKAEGKAATLLTQHRPNMFTQDIANLMPGKTVKISIRYVQNVPKIDDAYELVVPMIVGPRYEGAADPQVVHAVPGDDTSGRDEEKSGLVNPAVDTTVDGAAKSTDHAGWKVDKLPVYPKVIGLNVPDVIDPRRVHLDLSIDAAVPIGALWSDTHMIEVDGSDRQKAITFQKGPVIDNRDFVLRYQLAAEKDVSAGALVHRDAEKGGFLSMMIEPPKIFDPDTIMSREVVFVLDTSGSMNGKPMEASQTFMEAAIRALRPDDYFRILRFSNNTSQLSTKPLKASPENKQVALNFIRRLRANGGTKINRAINAAFNAAQPDNTLRIVVFLTDGYIGADRTVIKTVSDRIGNARIYAFGVGTSVNRFLLDGMAREGRGYARYVGIDETGHEAAAALAADLKTPVLTDISIDWNGLDVEGQTPDKISDLFGGGSVRVLGRFNKTGKHRVFVEGLVNGRNARMAVDLNLDETSRKNAGSEVIPLIWAREQIFNKNRELAIGGDKDEGLRREITKLGLDFSLQSRFTSFVAVSEKVVNPDPASARSAQVPLPKVAGITPNAYPNLNLTGSSAPEPQGIFLSLMAFVMGFGVWLRRKWHKTVAGWTKVEALEG